MREKKENPDRLCDRCRYPAHQHALVNYADGPLIGPTQLICPTALFREPTRKPKKAH